MFPTRYFADRFWAPRYWPKVGAGSGVVTYSFSLAFRALADLALAATIPQWVEGGAGADGWTEGGAGSDGWTEGGGGTDGWTQG